MSRYCPLRDTVVVYLDCLECETKVCKSPKQSRTNKYERKKEFKEKEKKSKSRRRYENARKSRDWN